MNRLDEIPTSLKSIKNPPKTLYYKGDVSLLNRRIISIVGGRSASMYAKDTTYLLAKKLTKSGFVIASGGALGIDTKAHEGAYPHTIAIFANSLDITYPNTNRVFIEKIYKDSLALSEKECGYSPARYDFVLRNRLTVALGEVLIVSEANIDSGSMKSVQYALESGKNIYVLPHRINESGGTNLLLKTNRATPIYDIDEFIASLGGDIKEEERDEILEFCKTSPFFSEGLNRFGEKIYEYELDGKIAIKDGRIKIV